jgi:hypothetical protein
VRWFDTSVDELVARPYIPQGYLGGLTLSLDTITGVRIASGDCCPTGFPGRGMVLGSSIVKTLSSVWVEGSGNGGRASIVSLVNGTWYHVFLIGKYHAGSDWTEVDAGFDTSLTAMNLLADAASDGYTMYRRIGSVYYVNAGTGIKPFRQDGDEFIFSDGTLADYGPLGPVVDTITPATLTVPPGIVLPVDVVCILEKSSGAVHTFLLYDGIEQTSGKHRVYFLGNTTAGALSYTARLLTSTSKQIAFECETNAPDYLTIYTSRWWDRRGRDA